MELDSRVRRFQIFEDMAISVKDLERENEMIIDELTKWREDYKSLKEEKEKLYSEMLVTLKEKDEEISNLLWPVVATENKINQRKINSFIMLRNSFLRNKIACQNFKIYHKKKENKIVRSKFCEAIPKTLHTYLRSTV